MHLSKEKLYNLLLPIIFIIMGNIFMLIFKIGEKYIYYWDISGYWVNAMKFTDLIGKDFSLAMNNLYQSILHDDYTLLPTLFFVPVFKFVSRSQLAFALTNYNLFAVPFSLLMYAFFLRQFNISGYLKKAAALLIIFTFTPLLTPLMGGYLDACGLPFAALLLLLIQRWDLSRFSLPHCLTATALILIMCFLRRWYSFWVISFFPAYFLTYAISERKSPKSIVIAFSNLFSAGILLLLTLFIFFRPFLDNVFNSNLSLKYSAYDFGGLSYNLKFIFTQFGAFFLLVNAAGIALSFAKKVHVRFAAFLLIQATLILIMFTRIQSLGVQHLYLFAPAALYFAVSAVTMIEKSRRNLIIYAFVLLFALNFAHSYFKIPIVQNADMIFSQKKLYKRDRNDVDEIKAMVDFINNETGGKQYVYVLASSGVLNCDLLNNAMLPEKYAAVQKLLYTPDVDLRDCFPMSFYTADLIVVANPVQYHLDPDNQRLIGIIADAILDGKAENSLKKIAEFNLDDGISAEIYRKTGTYSHAFIDYIDEKFSTAYPDLKTLNETKSITSYIFDLEIAHDREIYLFKENGAFNRDEIGVGVGIEGTSFKINLEAKCDGISFKMTANYNHDGESGGFLTVLNDKAEILGEFELTREEMLVELDTRDNMFVEFVFSAGDGGAYVGIREFDMGGMEFNSK